MTLSRAVSALSAPDYALMHCIHRWQAPRWIRRWMLWATRSGDGWLWWIFGIAVLASPDHARFWAVAAAGLAVTIGILMFKVMKRAVGRKRPCEIEPHCWAGLLPPDRFSFPSGHSITAF